MAQAHSPRDDRHWIGQARRQAASGQHKAALQSYQRALPRAPAALLSRLAVLQASNDQLGVEACYRRLLAQRPDRAGVRVRLGLLLVGAGRLAEAGALCAAAPATTPRLLGLRGVVAHKRGAVPTATTILRQAADAAPRDTWILGNLASVLEEGNRHTEAREVAARALSIEPGHSLASAVMATLDRADGDSAAAAARLEAALSAPLPMQQRAWMLRELGAARERLGEPDAAFSAFVEFNHLSWQLAGRPPAALPSRLDASREAWSRLPRWPERQRIDDGFQDPIFVVGFPRSGTSLVREMLDAHPALRCTDEQPFLPDLLAGLPDLSPAAIASLSEPAIAALRARYRQAAAAHYPLTAGQRLVDKLPLNLIHAGLIARLFPDARLLVLIRDPRDCCLSAFMQSFRSNAAMDCFYTVEDAARLYDAVFSLWAAIGQAAPRLSWRALRYEDLVEDTEATLRDALSALEIPWSPEVLEYAPRAAGRHIRTPSRADVQQPIFRRALARWRRYADHIEPAMSTLEPWARAHGYLD